MILEWYSNDRGYDYGIPIGIPKVVVASRC
jgi:hypothetical protein